MRRDLCCRGGCRSLRPWVLLELLLRCSRLDGGAAHCWKLHLQLPERLHCTALSQPAVEPNDSIMPCGAPPLQRLFPLEHLLEIGVSTMVCKATSTAADRVVFTSRPNFPDQQVNCARGPGLCCDRVLFGAEGARATPAGSAWPPLPVLVVSRIV